MLKGLRTKLSGRYTMQGKINKYVFFLLTAFFLQHICSAQDTLSKITFYGDKDPYQKCIGKEFEKLNRWYRTGIKHGLFYMYDLVDNNNKLVSENDTLYLINSHLYHVVSPNVYGKVSMIIIPYNDSIFAFIGLNCCKKRHNVEDVVRWVLNNFKNVNNSTLCNIRQYYIFHPNIPTDPQGSIPKCELRCLRHLSQNNIIHYRKPKIIFRGNKRR